MTETNTTRFSLRQWSTGSDTPSRLEIGNSFLQIENLAAIDVQDTAANKPGPGVRGRYFWDTTNNMLSRDSGSAWSVVGSRVLDGYSKASTTGAVAYTVDAPSGQTADLQQWKVNGTTLSLMDKSGGLSLGGSMQAKNGVFNGPDTLTNTLQVNGFSGQTAALFRVQNGSGSTMFQVGFSGLLTSPNFSTAGSGAGSTGVVGAQTSTSVAGFPDGRWTGLPAFEVRMNKTGGFNDFLLLKHIDAENSAGARRFGILMKSGNEDAAGVAQSGAMYLQSTDPFFANPAFKLDVSNTNIWTMVPDNVLGSVTPFFVKSSAYFYADNDFSMGSFRASNTWIGAQNSGNDQYYRVAGTSNQFSWYAGGSHNSGSGNAGSGGTTWMTLNATKLVTGRIQVTQTSSDVDVTQQNPPIMVGSVSGSNLQIDDNEIMNVNNGVAGQLMLQIDGGSILLGSSGTKTYLAGSRIHIHDNTGPSSPEAGAIWIRPVGTGSGGGLYRWSPTISDWVKFA